MDKIKDIPKLKSIEGLDNSQTIITLRDGTQHIFDLPIKEVLQIIRWAIGDNDE